MSGNYLPEVLRIATSAEPGTATWVSVLHDDWCAYLAGAGPCDCRPEIVVRQVDALEEPA